MIQTLVFFTYKQLIDSYMKVNLNKNFKGIDGQELPGGTMLELLEKGLFSGAGVGKNEEDKLAAYKLLNRLINEGQGEIEFDKDERKLLRSVACASMIPGAFGQVVELIKD